MAADADDLVKVSYSLEISKNFDLKSLNQNKTFRTSRKSVLGVLSVSKILSVIATKYLNNISYN